MLLRLQILAVTMIWLVPAHSSVIVLDATGKGNYLTIADAISNSIANDTIYVVGSGASYGNIALSSPRTILGNGYFGQSLGYSPEATFGTITINSGAGASVLIGLSIGSITFNNGDVSFISCAFSGSTTIGAAISNVSIAKSYFSSTLNIQGSSITVKNSILNYPSAGNSLTVSAGASLTLSYNTFYDGNLTLESSTVDNCIVNSTRVSQTVSVIVDGIAGNKLDAEANLLFNGSSGNDTQFQLQGGSPALVSSQDSAESGAFGFPLGQSEEAYTLFGLPSIPKITSLEHGASATTSSNLTIRIQATTN